MGQGQSSQELVLLVSVRLGRGHPAYRVSHLWVEVRGYTDAAGSTISTRHWSSSSESIEAHAGLADTHSTSMVVPVYFCFFSSATLITSFILYQGLKASAVALITMVLGFLTTCLGITLLQMSLVSVLLPRCSYGLYAKHCFSASGRMWSTPFVCEMY
jgi:hypothetical protein